MAHLWRTACATGGTCGMASRCPPPSRAAPPLLRWRSRWGRRRRSCSRRPHLGTRRSPAGTCGRPSRRCAAQSSPPPSTVRGGSCSRRGRPRLESSRRRGPGTRRSLRRAAASRHAGRRSCEQLGGNGAGSSSVDAVRATCIVWRVAMLQVYTTECVSDQCTCVLHLKQHMRPLCIF